MLHAALLFVVVCLADQVVPQAPAKDQDPAAAKAAAPAAGGRQQDLQSRLQERLAQFCEEHRVPGATAAVVRGDAAPVAVAAGVRQLGEAAPMLAEDRMFCGSIGKIWFASVALQLVHDGKLSLDDKIRKHLAGEPWFERLPNHDAITVRNLMRHDSGLPRWIEMPGALAEMAKPDRSWTNGEQVQFVLDKPALHEAGDGWGYSDTNYIVLGMIVEKVAKRAIYDLVQEQVIARHKLTDTVPGNRRAIPGLVQGHVRMFRSFGFPEHSLARIEGKQQVQLRFDPSSEWCGGGIVTSAADLARWGRIYAKGKDRQSDAVAAVALGPGTRYGLGIMLRDSELGPTRGHDGVFIGYSAKQVWFEKHDLAVAILANTDTAGRGMAKVAVDLARIAIAAR